MRVFAVLLAVAAALAAAEKPNLILMLADDLGWYNLGYRGNPEINSPAIDSLANSGLRLERHYVYKYCSPTRSSALSGRLPLHVNQNNNNNDVQAASGVDLRMTMLPAKLKQAGYSTHMTGKWHLGARSVANLPINRGFDSHLGFLKGGEDHWTQGSSDGSLRVVDLWKDHGPAYGLNGTYSTYLYGNAAVDLINKHDQSNPFFLYLPWHVTHNPLEAPEEVIKPVDNDPNKVRRMMNAMVTMLDQGVANVTRALKENNMWNNTLIVFSADNGGWITNNKLGGNNYPLRGGKVSDFEGGVRVNAFLNGGYLPDNLRGKNTSSLIHVTDWYATFCALAGVDPKDPQTGVPDIDSINVWPAILNETQPADFPRQEVPLGYCTPEADCDENNGPSGSMVDAALIVGNYKIVTGYQGGLGYWQGPQFPNGSEPKTDPGCPHGCLFDIVADPAEHHDLRTEQPKLFQQLMTRLQDIGKTVYQTNYTGGYDNCIARPESYKMHHGFLAPECH